MVEWGRRSDKGRNRAETWPQPQAESRRRAWAWTGDLREFSHTAAHYVRQWAIVDTGPGRLFPWLPIAYGLGVAIYFSAEREPAVWAASGLALIAVIAAFLARHRPFAFPLALGFAAVVAGFAVATLKSAQVSHPTLARPTGNVQVAGFVEVREERERSDRIVVQALRLDGYRLEQKPNRLRVSVRKGTAPAVGTYVEFRARLNPPLAPLRPGGYDFARDLYFQGIGAVGFVLGSIRTAAPPVPQSPWLSYASEIGRMRDAIDQRIRAVVSGDRGSIASALITGKRDAISTPVNDAMYISSLAHVLSISGYHMALVAGVVFFTLRALLALIPSLASNRPIKKWAAMVALCAAGFYLLLSGAEVATQRAFIMIAIVLVGVMVDRAALTLRTLALAALAVLLIAPQALVHPSFQMSFAATLALVAAYQHGLPRFADADSSIGARLALWGGREILGLVLASVVAGLATTPYAAFHFHRLAPYGVLANLLAMPIVSVWVMPAGVLALIAIPFGFDGPLWRLMADGIDWMIAVALWVAKLPGSVGHMAAFGAGPLLLGTGGLVMLCLLRSPLRWGGPFLIAWASLWAIHTPLPDVFVSADGKTAAVRGADGRLAAHYTARHAFTVREWLAADGDARLLTDPTLSQGFRCDEAGCIGQLSDGRLVALVLGPEAFEEDCRLATIVISAREAPPGCAALTIDQRILRTQGATTLRREGEHWLVTAARPIGQDRPWAWAQPVRHQDHTFGRRPKPTDATPSLEGLEARY